jgi:hypothetical protein
MKLIFLIFFFFCYCPAQIILEDGSGTSSGGGGEATYTDDFNRSNQDPLSGNWTLYLDGGNIKLQSNAVWGNDATGSSGVNQFAYRNVGTYGNGQYSQIKFTASITSEIGGISVRNQINGSVLNCYFVSIVNSSHAEVWCHYGTSWGTGWEQIGSNISIVVASGDVIKLNVSGSVLSLYQNGSLIGSVTDSNNRITTGGRPGFWLDNTSNGIFDDWGGG